MGRPTELTDAVQASICRDLAAGLPRESAARRARISLRTFHRWLGRGRDDGAGVYHQFSEAVRKAEHDAVARNVALVQSAAADDWRAAAWWLEHAYPDVWAIRRRDFLELRRLLKQFTRRNAGPDCGQNEQQVLTEMTRCIGGEALPLLYPEKGFADTGLGI